jgi:SRSO17 transposase
VEDGVPGDILLCDAAYGSCDDFREAVRILGFDYAMGINSTNKLVLLDAQDRCRGAPRTARKIAEALGPKAFRKVTWREGTRPDPRGKLCSRFAFCRVKVAHAEAGTLADREPLWLLVEWPEEEKAPTKFALTTLRRTMSKKQIVRIFKERYRTERVYEEMKGELGLDHFEGRSFPGWHHHVSVALCCYAFVIAERMRHFPPSDGRRSPSRTHPLAA